MYLKVDGNIDLVRDIHTRAIINTNSSEYDNYLKHRDKALSQQSQIEQNVADINNIKQDLKDIKQMLFAIVNKESN